MKKLSLLLLGGGLLLSLASLPSTNSDSYLGTSEALFGTHEEVQLRRAASEGEVKTSKTYVQNGEYNGKRCLRFATAVKGDFASLSYYVKVEGLDNDYLQEEVKVVYKGLSAGQVVSYYDGTKVVDSESKLTNDWYWACYTISYKDETHWNANVDAYLVAKSSDGSQELKSEQKSSSLYDSRYEDNSLVKLESSLMATWKAKFDDTLLTLTFEGEKLIADVNGTKLTLHHDGYVTGDENYHAYYDNKGNALYVRYNSYSELIYFYGKLDSFETTTEKSMEEYVPVSSLTLTTKNVNKVSTEFIYGVDNSFTIKPEFDKKASGYGSSLGDIKWEVSGDTSAIANNFIGNDGTFASNTLTGTGKVRITAKSLEGVSASVEITIREKVNVEGIKFVNDVNSTSLDEGLTHTIEVEFLNNCDVKDLVFSSSDEDIATVTKNSGIITAEGKGTATITVTATNGTTTGENHEQDDKTLYFTVTVNEPSTPINNAFLGTFSGYSDNEIGTTIEIKYEDTGVVAIITDEYGSSATFSFVSSSGMTAKFSWESWGEPEDMDLSLAGDTLYVVIKVGNMTMLNYDSYGASDPCQFTRQ